MDECEISVGWMVRYHGMAVALGRRDEWDWMGRKGKEIESDWEFYLETRKLKKNVISWEFMSRKNKRKS